MTFLLVIETPNPALLPVGWMFAVSGGTATVTSITPDRTEAVVVAESAINGSDDGKC